MSSNLFVGNEWATSGQQATRFFAFSHVTIGISKTVTKAQKKKPGSPAYFFTM